MDIKNLLNKKLGKKGVELSLSTIIILILVIAFIIVVVLFSGSLRTYILSFFERFSFRGR